MKKNLLLAAYTNYKEISKVQDFVESFGHVRRPNDEMCVIYDEQTEINHFLDQYPFVTQIRKPRESENAYADRFKQFADTIMISEHERFICADIRDIVFQTNPFVWMEKNLENSLVVCDEGVPHSSEKGGIFTLNQVRDGFPDYEHSIFKKNVINVGCIGGDKRVGHICQRVYEMCQTVTDEKIHTNGSYAFDQAAMGILCHLTEERAFTHHSDGNETWCLTMSTSPESLPYTYLIENRLCNPEGQPYAIVHQAERHSSFIRYKGQGKYEIFKGDEVWSTARIDGLDYKE